MIVAVVTTVLRHPPIAVEQRCNPIRPPHRVDWTLGITVGAASCAGEA